MRALTIMLCSVLALQSIFPDSGLSSISELPELVSDYQAHKREDGNMTFLAFFHLHFDPSSKHFDQHRKDHEKLPLSKRHLFTSIFHFLNSPFAYFDSVQFAFLRSIDEVSYADQKDVTVIVSIWQPPRA